MVDPMRDIDIAEVGCSSHPEPTEIRSARAYPYDAGASRGAASRGEVAFIITGASGRLVAGVAGSTCERGAGRKTYPTAGTEVIVPGTWPPTSSL